MDETNKLPLKRVELSLTKFNEVAIPHHLDLLRQHKANIIKYEQSGEWARVRSEQTHARRVAAQLRALLGELEALRRQVAPADLPRFDAATQHARDLTLRAVVDYLGAIESSCRTLGTAAREQLKETSPLSINRQAEAREAAASVVSTDSVGVVAEPELIQLQVDEHELALREREAVLRGWCALQEEVRALHAAWQAVAGAAAVQRGRVAAGAGAVLVAQGNVQAARAELSSAERLRAGAYGVGGAALGALAGGPVGLLIGIKAGAAALVAGSAIGYWGARILGSRRQKQLEAPDDDTEKDKTQ
ncbi:syntaxin-17 isoform X1 [Pectinophora gossypiella]|uniref:syntaxin-17 isoform X1 n=1 Tax=Pectinophora gossypiella TaxID=13191 RepID=UPI00214E172D|nr:syntaxin-17 isoform X1 [Pectinophora gossypiella]